MRRYKRRWTIERAIAWLQSTAASFRGMVQPYRDGVPGCVHGVTGPFPEVAVELETVTVGVNLDAIRDFKHGLKPIPR